MELPTAPAPLRANCPACRGSTLLVTTLTHEVPYFGNCMETLARCEACAFRHVDFFPLDEKPAARYTLRVTDAQDLAARVVRSNSGTIRVPEIGFTQEPTAISEAYVTNVEGVLDRVRDILVRACVIYAETEPEKVVVAERKLDQLARMLAFQEPTTLVIEDPRGASAIVSERAQVDLLTPEEAASLQTGMVVLDKRDLDELQ